MPVIEVVECGCCGHYHVNQLTGDLYYDDCRNDQNRFDGQQLDKMFGKNGWIDVTEDENE